MYGTPTMFADMINRRDFSQYDVSSLEIVVISGAPCPEELAKSVVAKFNLKNVNVR